MPRHSTADREVADGPWPRGLNSDSDARFIGDGELPYTIDCDFTLTGGVKKRDGVKLVASGATNSTAILCDYLHDGRMVIGEWVGDTFSPTTDSFKLSALPERQFLSDTSYSNAVSTSVSSLSGTGRYNYPSVARMGGRTYITFLGYLFKWDGSAWSVTNYTETGSPAYDDGMIGYYTRQATDGVPQAVSDIRTAGIAQTAPTSDSDREDGGGGFPKADLIKVYQVGDRQVMLAAVEDKLRYSFPTPYGVGVTTGDAAVYGPQDWLEDAWMDVGQAAAFDYITAIEQIEDTLYVFKRSSIWRVYGDLSPGGLRVQKVHEGIGVRHAGLVSVGAGAIVFYDLVTNSLWAMDQGGALTDLWNQRIGINLSGQGTGRNFVYNSFVHVHHNKVYVSLPSEDAPNRRSYITDLETANISMWSLGYSVMLSVEFFGNYGLLMSPKVDNQAVSAFAWILETSRIAGPVPESDELGPSNARNFESSIDSKALVPSVPSAGSSPDWSAVSPKWRRALLTVSSDSEDDDFITIRFNGSGGQLVLVPAGVNTEQVWSAPVTLNNVSSVQVNAILPPGVTLHRVAMRYWRRR